MPAIRTFAKPVNDTVTVSIPAEYRSYSIEVILLPIMDGGFADMPQPALTTPREFAKRKLGGFEKGFYMAPDFDEPIDEFSEYM